MKKQNPFWFCYCVSCGAQQGEKGLMASCGHFTCATCAQPVNEKGGRTCTACKAACNLLPVTNARVNRFFKNISKCFQEWGSLEQFNRQQNQDYLRLLQAKLRMAEEKIETKSLEAITLRNTFCNTYSPLIRRNDPAQGWFLQPQTMQRQRSSGTYKAPLDLQSDGNSSVTSGSSLGSILGQSRREGGSVPFRVRDTLHKSPRAPNTASVAVSPARSHGTPRPRQRTQLGASSNVGFTETRTHQEPGLPPTKRRYTGEHFLADQDGGIEKQSNVFQSPQSILKMGTSPLFTPSSIRSILKNSPKDISVKAVPKFQARPMSVPATPSRYPSTPNGGEHMQDARRPVSQIATPSITQKDRNKNRPIGEPHTKTPQPHKTPQNKPRKSVTWNLDPVQHTPSRRSVQSISSKAGSTETENSQADCATPAKRRTIYRSPPALESSPNSRTVQQPKNLKVHFTPLPDGLKSSDDTSLASRSPHRSITGQSRPEPNTVSSRAHRAMLQKSPRSHTKNMSQTPAKFHGTPRPRQWTQPGISSNANFTQTRRFQGEGETPLNRRNHSEHDPTPRSRTMQPLKSPGVPYAPLPGQHSSSSRHSGDQTSLASKSPHGSVAGHSRQGENRVPFNVVHRGTFHKSPHTLNMPHNLARSHSTPQSRQWTPGYISNADFTETRTHQEVDPTTATIRNLPGPESFPQRTAAVQINSPKVHSAHHSSRHSDGHSSVRSRSSHETILRQSQPNSVPFSVVHRDTSHKSPRTHNLSVAQAPARPQGTPRPRQWTQPCTSSNVDFTERRSHQGDGPTPVNRRSQSAQESTPHPPAVQYLKSPRVQFAPSIASRSSHGSTAEQSGSKSNSVPFREHRDMLHKSPRTHSQNMPQHSSRPQGTPRQWTQAGTSSNTGFTETRSHEADGPTPAKRKYTGEHLLMNQDGGIKKKTNVFQSSQSSLNMGTSPLFTPSSSRSLLSSTPNSTSVDVVRKTQARPTPVPATPSRYLSTRNGNGYVQNARGPVLQDTTRSITQEHRNKSHPIGEVHIRSSQFNNNPQDKPRKTIIWNPNPVQQTLQHKSIQGKPDNSAERGKIQNSTPHRPGILPSTGSSMERKAGYLTQKHCTSSEINQKPLTSSTPASSSAPRGPYILYPNIHKPKTSPRNPSGSSTSSTRSFSGAPASFDRRTLLPKSLWSGSSSDTTTRSGQNGKKIDRPIPTNSDSHATSSGPETRRKESPYIAYMKSKYFI